MTLKPTLSHPRPPTDTQLRKIVIASIAGNALEWYDFFLYGTAQYSSSAHCSFQLDWIR
jgi:hypothetical protein